MITLNLLVLAAFSIDATHARPAVETTDFKSTIIYSHNAERALVGSPPLEWDEHLAQDAALWAQELANTRSFRHDASRPQQGENLWMGSKGYYSLQDMLGSWSEEKKKYAPYRQQRYLRASHYTQQIWKNTRSIGCAIAKTRQHEIFVCRYYPAGNVIGQSPYN